MDFVLVNHSGADGSVTVVNGECDKCKDQKNKGRNSLILLKTKTLTPSVKQLNLVCIVCKMVYKTNVRTSQK